MSFSGENLHDLGGKADANPQGRLRQGAKKPIVKATTSSQPGTLSRESHPRDQDDGGWTLGHHSPVGFSRFGLRVGMDCWQRRPEFGWCHRTLRPLDERCQDGA